MEKTEYFALMRNRENLYVFLGRLFREELNLTLLRDMKAMSFPHDSGNNELNEGYQVLEEYLKNLQDDSLDILAADYARIFLGAGIAEGSAAYPYESVYTSKERIIMQKARDEVMAIYKAKGLAKDDKISIFGEDHIALEMEFMAYLCKEVQSYLNKEDSIGLLFCLKEQKDFLNQHLLNWVPYFCNDIYKYADTEFYKGIGKIANSYLGLDNTILETLISEF